MGCRRLARKWPRGVASLERRGYASAVVAARAGDEVGMLGMRGLRGLPRDVGYLSARAHACTLVCAHAHRHPHICTHAHGTRARAHSHARARAAGATVLNAHCTSTHSLSLSHTHAQTHGRCNWCGVFRWSNPRSRCHWSPEWTPSAAGPGRAWSATRALSRPTWTETLRASRWRMSLAVCACTCAESG